MKHAEIAALILAAGSSTRMGPRNKLVLPVAGEPMLARVVRAALDSRVRHPPLVVRPPNGEDLQHALRGLDVEWVENPDAASGMASSLAAGIGALSGAEAGVLVCLGDMPWVRAADIDALIERFEAGGPATIWIASHAGQRGHPVLFAAEHFAALRELRGDRGARALIERNPQAVESVSIDHPGVLRDIDTPEELERYG